MTELGIDKLEVDIVYSLQTIKNVPMKMAKIKIYVFKKGKWTISHLTIALELQKGFLEHRTNELIKQRLQALYRKEAEKHHIMLELK